MKELDKKIVGDWVDLREASRNFFSLIEYLKPDKSQLKDIHSNLENSVENGMFEYKESKLNPFFRLIDEAKFKNIQINTLEMHKNSLKSLLFTIQVQRLFTTKAIPLRKNTQLENVISAKNIEINSILKDVLARIKDNPTIKSHSAIKNILVQISVYKREKAILQELSATKGSKNKNFIENFRKTFEKIFKSIRKNYEILLKEEVSQLVRKNPLSLINIDKISPILFKQSREIMKIISTINHILLEKYKIRSILLNLSQSQDTLRRLIENELIIFQKEAEFNKLDALVISRGFCLEIATYLQKYIKKEYSITEAT